MELKYELDELEKKINDIDSDILKREDSTAALKRASSAEIDRFIKETDEITNVIMAKCQRLQELNGTYPDESRIAALLQRYAMSGHRLVVLAKNVCGAS